MIQDRLIDSTRETSAETNTGSQRQADRVSKRLIARQLQLSLARTAYAENFACAANCAERHGGGGGYPIVPPGSTRSPRLV